MSKFNFDASKMRPGQRQAFVVFMERIRNGQLATAGIIPTRYGKSDLQRIVAMAAQSSRLVAGSLFVTPSLYLVSQMTSQKELAEMSSRYSIDVHMAMKCRLSAHPADELDWFGNGEYGICMTQQVATMNASAIVQDANELRERTGLSTLMFVDECDETVLGKSRGGLLEAWINSGHSVVLVTALADREDAERVFGFEYEECDRGESVRYEAERVRKPDGSDVVKVKKFHGTKVSIRVRAHVEVTYADAYAESPSPLCRLARVPIDAVVRDAEQREIGFLSTSCEKEGAVSKDMVTKCLGQWVRSPEAIELGCRALLHDLRINRMRNTSAAAIVYSGNDRPSISAEDNAHAIDIRRCLQQLGPEYGFKRLKVVVATQKNDTEQTIADKIQEFVDGDGDVIILKQAGGRGVTAGRAKTLLDLSPVRTRRALIQRWMRVGTPWDGFETATIITPADCFSDRTYREVIESSGGSFDMAEIVDEELVESYEKEPEPPRPESCVEASGALLFGCHDNDGRQIDAATYETAKRIYAALGHIGLKEKTTPPQLIQLFGSQGIEITASGIACNDVASQPKSITQAVKSMRDKCNALAKAIVDKTYPYKPGSDEFEGKKYEQTFQDVWARAKASVGLPCGVALKSITNLDSLTKVHSQLERMSHA